VQKSKSSVDVYSKMTRPLSKVDNISERECGNKMKECNYTRRNFLRAAGFGLAWLGLTDRVKCAKRGHERPNFILIIADDMGDNDCGAYGHPTIRTPNIDRLANEGIRFNYAFLTTSSCTA